MKGVPGVMVLLSHVSLASALGTLMPCVMTHAEVTMQRAAQR